ncbi:MAG: fumarylacetoacetase [Candidatus Krumholzibacteriota bacterium]|nr:fumarylacetoacetase [Candidatus Krumholzibacteriota bacterium]
MNETNDPTLASWVESAAGSDFPIQNLPFGVFSRRGDTQSQRVGVAIGDYVFDVTLGVAKGLFEGDAERAASACSKPWLNALMALGREHWTPLRARLSECLRVGNDQSRDEVESCLIPMEDVEMRLGVEIGDYTDFYASVFHATNVGRMFRPDNPLLPNYKHVPVGYHGRASSIVLSGTPVRRPLGQTKADDVEAPAFGPSRLLDYEIEMGFFVGPENAHGKPIPIDRAEDHIFGMCIVNDWSARDIQKWEYQPLGPFLAKSFATSVSPWVVTLDALEPFRTGAFERPPGDPRPLPYLFGKNDQARGGIDMTLEVSISSRQMIERGVEPMRLTRGNFRDMYWTIAQMLTHHASNGCNLRTGDMMASGTVSGEDKSSRGCLLELTERGSDPVRLPTGEERKFLQDGDEVVFHAYCEREGAARIGFGECRGVIMPAPPNEERRT